MTYFLRCPNHRNKLFQQPQQVSACLAQVFLHMMISERAVAFVNGAEHQIFTTQLNNLGVWTVLWRSGPSAAAINSALRCGLAAVRRMTPSQPLGMADIGTGEAT